MNNKLEQHFLMLCFSENELPWYYKIYKNMLYVYFSVLQYVMSKFK